MLGKGYRRRLSELSKRKGYSYNRPSETKREATRRGEVGRQAGRQAGRQGGKEEAPSIDYDMRFNRRLNRRLGISTFRPALPASRGL
jgi:predicted transposase YdaD